MTSHAIRGILPVKHNSQRVPGKNFRPFLGKPLFEHMLATLAQSALVDSVVVDTDSDWLIDYLAENWPQVTTLRRPDYLAQSSTPMNDVLQHTMDNAAEDFFLQVHTTSPLLTAGTIDRAIEFFWAHWPEQDSVFSVTRKQERLWSKDAQPLNHDPKVLLPTQDLDPIFVENSCLYLFNREVFQTERGRIGKNPALFVTPDIESVDIDTEADFDIAEALGRGFVKPEGDN